MYRAFAFKALRTGLPLNESAGLESLAAETSIRLEPGEGGNRVLLDGEDVTGLIRNQTVTDAASQVSVWPAIRAWMSVCSRRWAPEAGWSWRAATSALCLSPGRGQNLSGRRSRSARPAPVRSAWAQTTIQPQEVIRDLHARDERDRNRADSPLKPAPDAVLLDSTNLTLEEVVAAAELSWPRSSHPQPPAGCEIRAIYLRFPALLLQK